MKPMTEGFLIGIILTTLLTASLFFLKFWRRTRDELFLVFSLAFLMEAANRLAMLLTEKPSDSGPWYYVARMFAFLLIVAAILKKNYGKSGDRPS